MEGYQSRFCPWCWASCGALHSHLGFMEVGMGLLSEESKVGDIKSPYKPPPSFPWPESEGSQDPETRCLRSSTAHAGSEESPHCLTPGWISTGRTAGRQQGWVSPSLAAGACPDSTFSSVQWGHKAPQADSREDASHDWGMAPSRSPLVGRPLLHTRTTQTPVRENTMRSPASPAPVLSSPGPQSSAPLRHKVSEWPFELQPALQLDFSPYLTSKWLLFTQLFHSFLSVQ